MAGILFRTAGKIVAGSGRAVLLLTQAEPKYVLRLGYVLRGTEEILLPESLLDDWGSEKASLELYTWVRENGEHFPRAELFGFDPIGRPLQRFVRELDLTAGFACFVYEAPQAPLDSGLRLMTIILPRAHSGPPERGEAPAHVAFPLRDAAVEWWSADPSAAEELARTHLSRPDTSNLK